MGIKTWERVHYRKLMKNLTIDVSEYQQLKRAFQGGFTHANAWYSRQTVQNVTSYDITSSYPTVMVAEQFPMGRARIIDHKNIDLPYYLEHYCCIFDVCFIQIESQIVYESYISISRCSGAVNTTVNNGRLVTADRIYTTVTDVDFDIISKVYSWKELYIGTFRIYHKGYLPTDFVRSILYLYQDKTTLKNVDGKEVEYNAKKGMINASYGMTVTDVAKVLYEYSDDWIIKTQSKEDIENAIDKYNTNSNRFLFYPWGVWITAYARHNLWDAILECQTDYIYSDTDSVKIVNAEKHAKFFSEYNQQITIKLDQACAFHEIDPEMTRPKTINGTVKQLGVFDFDGHYAKFKTLGAKRYLVLYSNDMRNGKERGKYKMTVSGLSKKDALNYMLEKYKESNIFDAFDDDLSIPAQYTGKLTHTYIDDPVSTTLTDYFGNTATIHEKSMVHLEPAPYELSMAQTYIDYILGVQEDEGGI